MATLLEITQEILSDMTSDEVNSISDSAESEAVARIVVATYEAMVSNRNWPHLRELLKITAFSDSTKPTHMLLPSNVKELITLNYNKRLVGETRIRYEPVKWKDPDAFLVYTNRRNSTATSTQTVTDATGVKLLIENNAHPTYFTSFDDETIIMDSFNSPLDNTLQEVHTQAFGYIMPTTSFTDDWEPDLPKEAMRALIEEAKSKAQFKINTINDPKAEQESVRQQRWLSRKAWTINGGIRYPDYGRKGRRTVTRDVNFKTDK